MVAAAFTVQADFSGSAFGGAPTWTDITAYVLTSDGDPTIDINWGRQDEDSDPQPRTCTMTLDNSDGRFTPGLTTGPYGSAVDIGVRVRVSTTANAVTTVRFDGYINDWDAEWDNGGPMAVCALSASDSIAWMGTLQPLRAILIEEALLDNPGALYPFDEAADAMSGGDATGKHAAATVTNSKYGAGTLTFGAETTIIGAAGVVSMSSPDSGISGSGSRGTYLSVPNGLPASGAFSVDLWFLGPAAHSGTAEYLLSLPGFGGAVGPGGIFLSINGATGVLVWSVWGASVTLSGSGTHDVDDGRWHHVAITLAADGKTATLYLDGAVESTGVNLADIAWVNGGTVWSIGMLTAGGNIGFPLAGSVAMFGQYTGALSLARVAAHYNAGANGFAGERTDVRAARLLGYRPNVGSVLDVGKGTVGIQDTNGVALADALSAVGKAEGGPVMTDGQDRVMLLNRGRLYDPAVGLTLDASLDQVTAALQFRRDTQDVTNDVTISRPGGASERVTNAASVAKYGTRAKTDTLIVNSDRDAADAAGWAVAVGKTVKTKSPQLEVDLLMEPSAAQAAAVLAAGPLTVANITNLPAATSPATSVKAMIQGAVETISVDDWRISFYATAMPPSTLRADAAPSANTKLDNGLVIPW